MSDVTGAQPGIFEEAAKKYQYLLDKSSPHMLYRWIAFVVCLLIYFLRVYYKNGWFIVTYGLGIYLLNQFIGFLSPQVCFSHSESPFLIRFLFLFSLTQKRMILIQDYQQKILMNSGEIFENLLFTFLFALFSLCTWSSTFFSFSFLDLLLEDYQNSNFGILQYVQLECLSL
jgi:hypothetical protein